jgi:hypothetical protein
MMLPIIYINFFLIHIKTRIKLDYSYKSCFYPSKLKDDLTTHIKLFFSNRPRQNWKMI